MEIDRLRLQSAEPLQAMRRVARVPGSALIPVRALFRDVFSSVAIACSTLSFAPTHSVPDDECARAIAPDIRALCLGASIGM